MNTKFKKLHIAWVAVLSLLIMAGVYAASRALFSNADDVFHDDDNIPWTLLIATYVFFVLTSTGATMIATLSSVFGYHQFQPLEKRAVFIGIISLFAGFTAMLIELGNPLNMFYFLLTPNFQSPIWWMGFFYAMLLVVLLFEFCMMHNQCIKGALRKILPLASLILELAALSTLGSVFGLIEARPNFFGEYIQVYFLFTALLSGISAILFFSLITYKFRFGKIPSELEPMFEQLTKVFGLILALCLVFSIWRVFIGLYSIRPEFETLSFMVQSFSYRMEIFIGLMIPLSFMIVKAIRQSYWGKLTAAIMVFIGLGLGRMMMVMLGQLMPIIPKYQDKVEVIEYFPTIWEWMIGGLSLALLLLLYTLGERNLRLDQTILKEVSTSNE